MLTGWLDRREREAIAYLIEENRLLRRQLGTRRLRLTDDDRRRLAARAYRVGRAALREIATIATPDTLLRWHRRLIARVHGELLNPVHVLDFWILLVLRRARSGRPCSTSAGDDCPTRRAWRRAFRGRRIRARQTPTLILNRSDSRSPILRFSDRMVAGLCALPLFHSSADVFPPRA